MVLHVTPEIEARIAERLITGHYSDVDDILDKALSLLQEQERLERLRALLLVGQTQVVTGDVVTYTPELRAQIHASARRRALSGDKPNPDVGP